MKRKSVRKNKSTSKRKSSSKGTFSLFGVSLTRWVVLSAFVLALPVAILLNKNTNTSSPEVLPASTVVTSTPTPTVNPIE